MFEGEIEGPATDFEMYFEDLESIYGEGQRYTMTKKYLDMLYEKLKLYDHYMQVRNIKRIISPTGDDKTGTDIFVILAYFRDTNAKFGLLMCKYANTNVGLIGLWPDTVVEMVKNDVQFLENVVDSLVFAPDHWKTVYLIE